jgi:hypothetical protein
MDSTLLQNLMTGAGSSSQFVGGLVVAVLYAVSVCSPRSEAFLFFGKSFNSAGSRYFGAHSWSLLPAFT